MRSKRKAQHIRHVVGGSLRSADFSDIRILHNCLPGASHTVDLTCKMAGFSLAAPFFVNAITGGARESEEINRKLALLCRHFSMPMALGSQKAALEDASLKRTYEVVRDTYPDGIILANLSAGCSIEEACLAVKMLRADALQLHLNAPQEMVMQEGDKVFHEWIPNIRQICSHVQVPVIVKETGFGMAAEQARILAEAGVKAVDISGRGGTNFIAIEAERAGVAAGEMEGWGIPTPISLVEALETAGERMDVIASGGVNTPLSIVKCLALGACAVGLAAMPLKLVSEEGVEGAIMSLEQMLGDIKAYMALLGANRIRDLRHVPMVITGETYRWLKSRGFEPEKYARRDFRQLSWIR